MNGQYGSAPHTRTDSSTSSSLRSNRSRGGWPTVKTRTDGDDTDKGTDERGPLLDPPPYEGSLASPSEHASTISATDTWDQHEETKSTTYLILVTTCMLGLQIAWSVELASVSPFLLSLGLSKSLLALVWIAGPLSGTLVQPYVGIRSDDCRLAYGRRRPFMIGGTLATMICLLALSWTREIVSGFVSIFGVSIPTDGTHVSYQVFAVVLIYVLDFAINVIQAAVRAFIIDCTPSHQQETANAWASRVSGIGHIAAYIVGFVYLPGLFPWLGNTQFKVFVALACVVMASTMAISCIMIRERDPRTLDDPSTSSNGILAFFRSLFRSIRNLPPQVRKVCIVQIFAWIGWFPFLFYITTYIGGLYVEPFFVENPNMTDQQVNEVWEQGTRVGTLALLVFAIMTFASSVFLPMIIPPTYAPLIEQKGSSTRLASTPGTPGSRRPTDYFGDSSETLPAKPRRLFSRLCRFCDSSYLQISSLTLRRAWLLSHISFFFFTWLTFFVRTPAAGTILVGLIGIPWALTNWAPYALIAAEISRRDAIKRARRVAAGLPTSNRPVPISPGPSAAITHHPMSSSTDLEALMQDNHAPTSPSQHHDDIEGHDKIDDDATDQAGVLLGIHNVAIAAPQILATLVSSAMFKALQKPRGTPGDDSVGWVLRFGGLCALFAAWATKYVDENAQRR